MFFWYVPKLSTEEEEHLFIINGCFGLLWAKCRTSSLSLLNHMQPLKQKTAVVVGVWHLHFSYHSFAQVSLYPFEAAKLTDIWQRQVPLQQVEFLIILPTQFDPETQAK